MPIIVPEFAAYGEALFRLFVDTVRDYAIFAMDPDGKIVHWNAGAVRTTGYEETEVLGKPFTILFTREQIIEGAPKRELQIAADTGRAEDERWHERKDGSRFWALGIVVPIRASDGSLLGFGKILRDRTDLKELHENLRSRTEELERSDENKNRFLATLSHELRSPLAPLANGLDILRAHARDVPKLAAVIGVMDRQLLRLSRLVEDLLDLTRIGQGKLAVAREPLDLNPLLLESTEAVRPLAEARDIELVVEAACAGAFVAGDRYRLLQVFTNLLDNAIKFTPIGGKIMAILDVEEPEAVVRVRDTGVGFRAEDAERIFELFAQAHPALDQTRLGLGLGLAIVRDLVAIHGGTVQAQSAGEEKGSEFIVRLPLITSLAQH